MILVTGCAGFIGARVCEMLLDDGAAVIGLDYRDSPSRIQAWRLARLIQRPKFVFYETDVRDTVALARDLRRHPAPEAVLHLAAQTGVRGSFADPAGYFQTNTIGTLNLLEWCRTRHIPKLVLASTSSVYGNSPRPFREDLSANEPLSPYAASKKAAEMLAHLYRTAHSLDVTVLRYFTVYGPAGRPDMAVWQFAERIVRDEPVTVYGDGSQTRDSTYIDDIARGTLLAMQPGLAQRVFNLGAGEPVAVNDLVRLIGAAFEREPQIQYQPTAPGDAQDTASDSTLARQVLGWEPRVSLADGLREFARWYRSYTQRM